MLPLPTRIEDAQEKRGLKYTCRMIFAATMLSFGVAHANVLTAQIDTMQVHPPTNAGYLRLVGSPNFDGTGCTSIWAKGNLDDQNFMIYIWPLLMSAKNHGTSVTISVSGCSGGYPQIEWVQVNAT